MGKLLKIKTSEENPPKSYTYSKPKWDTIAEAIKEYLRKNPKEAQYLAKKYGWKD